MPQPDRDWYTYLRDTAPGAFLVASVLCTVCSVLVAGASVSLRAPQEANKLLFKQKNALMAAGLADAKASPAEVTKVFEESIVRELIDLSTGEPVGDGDVPFKIDAYDEDAASREKDLSVKIDPPSALPGIATREKYTFVYQIIQDDKPAGFILPIRGKGLWSTLKGFLSLEADGKTVRGITYYSHAETPGLGGEVDNPRWKALWKGKKVFGEDGAVALGVVKGVGADEYSVDGLSGATITSRGVDTMLKYWLGPEGYGKYLAKKAGVPSGDQG